MAKARRKGKFRRSAFTLLEVVVACVLLATLLVSALLAISAQQRKLSVAQDRQRAAQLADALLGQWLDSRDGIPLQGRGRFMDAPGFTWSTEVSSSANLLGTVTPIVRFQIYRSTTQRRVTVLNLEVLADRRS